jgi:hypothetical protein
MNTHFHLISLSLRVNSAPETFLDRNMFLLALVLAIEEGLVSFATVPFGEPKLYPALEPMDVTMFFFL